LQEGIIAEYKCLELIRQILRIPESTCSNSIVLNLLEKFVFPAVANPLDSLKEMGYECISFCSLNDESFGKVNFNVLVSEKRILNGSKQDVIMTFKFLFDWILLHGFFNFNEDEVILNPKKINNIIGLIFIGLEEEDRDVSAIVVEGLCKCLLFNHSKQHLDLEAVL
jgi:hypothetical protein